MARMRIAMYTDAFYPFPSGVSTSVLALAEALAQQNHHVYIQAPAPKKPTDLSFLHPNIQVQFVNAIDIMIYPDFRLAARLPLFVNNIREFNPDVIHIHTPMSLGLEGILVGKRLKIPLVQTFHTYYMDEDNFRLVGIYNKQLAQILKSGGWKLFQALSRTFPVTTAPTQFVAKDLKKHKTPGKIMICPNILPDDHYALHPHPQPRAERFLYVGRLSPEKRVDLLLEAFALHHQAHPTSKLIIIGDGPHRPELTDLAFDLGIPAAIQWYGKIPHAELIRHRLYHLGDVFITPSRYETFGYTTLEAMAHQVPVIALASRANTEIIGDTGWLLRDTTDPGRAVKGLARLMDEAVTADLNSMRKRAYERAKLYDPAHCLSSYLAAYETAIASYQAHNHASNPSTHQHNNPTLE